MNPQEAKAAIEIIGSVVGVVGLATICLGVTKIPGLIKRWQNRLRIKEMSRNYQKAMKSYSEHQRTGWR